MLPNNLTLAVNKECVWHIDHLHGSRKIFVRVQKNGVIPQYTIHVRRDATNASGVVNANGRYLNARLFLPIVIKFGVVVQFSLAGATPCGPKTN